MFTSSLSLYLIYKLSVSFIDIAYNYTLIQSKIYVKKKFRFYSVINFLWFAFIISFLLMNIFNFSFVKAYIFAILTLIILILAFYKINSYLGGDIC